MDANRVTVVTGGGRGIGRAIALRMSQDTSVLLVGRTEQNLAEVQREIFSAGGFAHYIVGDVSDPETAKHALSACQNYQFFNLVCNAGIGGGGPTKSFSEEKWQRVFAVNVHGVFYFIKQFVPFMVQTGNGGVVCLISSTAGLRGTKKNMAYCASKAAVNSMAESIAAEYSKKGIHCVAICPNFVEGEMTERTIKNYALYNQISEDKARQIIIDSTPEKRLIPEKEVAETIASACNGPISDGAIHVINGGSDE